MSFAGVFQPLPNYGEDSSVRPGEHPLSMARSRSRGDEESPESGTTESPSSSEVDKEIGRLARSMTNTTGGAVPMQNTFVSDEQQDASLDPHSPEFSPRAWVKNALAISSRDPARYPQRTAGFSFKNLAAHGFGSATDYQRDVATLWLSAAGTVRHWFTRSRGKRKIQILRDFDGVVRSGEMLVVLGRPGSGCSTFLKTIAGETHGFIVDEGSSINYQGISASQMHRQFRGEAIYTAETDVHFPQLTVSQTLSFAARARMPKNRFPGVSPAQYAQHLRDVSMTIFGLNHTFNTKVGNEYVRGVSGGERKRVSIAEAGLSASPLQCWDNSTRGLDSANAIEFCKTLRLSTELGGATACVAIYQAPQAAYDVFDKVVVLYEGRQIFFGPTTEAKRFFTDLGFICPERQTTSDFLTSLTSPVERIVREGWQGKVPRTPDEFADVWRGSEARKRLVGEIEAFDQEYPLGGKSLEQFVASRRAQQAKHQRISSPYTLSVTQQVRLCVDRGFQRLRGDMSLFISGLIGNFAMALIIGSVFYNLAPDTTSFYSRGALLFFAILLNAFASALEILSLYAQRPIVEKHSNYALYHPFAEAVSSMLCDLPYKLLNAVVFNITLYFMTNLRRTPGAFFVFFLFSVFCTLTMSMVFRTIGASSRTMAQALAPAAILILALVIYTGFTIPTGDMKPWFRWINYLNPIAYAFEALMVNEFSGRSFPCKQFVPDYQGVPPQSHICQTTGAVAGRDEVDGDMYLMASFQYRYDHLWRNFGILLAFMVFFCATHLLATEYISAAKSKGEVLIFRRGKGPKGLKTVDEETAATNPVAVDDHPIDRQKTPAIQKQTAIFHWEDVCYDIKIKKEDRRILDHVDGWVKPGTLTALMGVSGAGKTTLLDVLASRVTMGVVSGEMLVNGLERDGSFQRKTGYVQQQDLHLETSTVRESLAFSALLRQPPNVSRQEKLDYVEEVIKLLEMSEYADAIVGVPGEGLNVEQRKRLTIGVELAAKPQLLLFLDEPTSGLDSQTSWSILHLLEKLKDFGQAILCTIHQPSAMLFQRFDRLLFLAAGGKTVYFGEIGANSNILTSYFARNGAPPCPPSANPAEWMLEAIGAAPGTHTDIDWHAAWRASPEYRGVKAHLDELKTTLVRTPSQGVSDSAALNRFAAPFSKQFVECTKRVFAQYWRTPSYIYSKTALCTLSGLFIGFSFYKAENSQQGLQNQMFAVFMLMTIFGNLCQQIMPNFVVQRALYEARERPAKVYSWQAFMASNILVELPWNTLMAALVFFGWYYPIGLYRNAEPTNAVNERGALMFLFLWTFLLFTSTFAHMAIAGIEVAETAGNLGNLIFSLSLIFCGVLASPTQLPGFWIFMYRVSPFTYLVSGILSTSLSGTTVQCSDIEILHFDPTGTSTCGAYMADFTSRLGGKVLNPQATSGCEFCAIADTDTFLAGLSASFSDAWRNFGLMWIYIAFNIAMAAGFYWLVRVPKGSRVKSAKEVEGEKEKGEKEKV